MILDFGGFDSSTILSLRGGILGSVGNFPESLSQQISQAGKHPESLSFKPLKQGNIRKARKVRVSNSQVRREFTNLPSRKTSVGPRAAGCLRPARDEAVGRKLGVSSGARLFTGYPSWFINRLPRKSIYIYIYIYIYPSIHLYYTIWMVLSIFI